MNLFPITRINLKNSCNKYVGYVLGTWCNKAVQDIIIVLDEDNIFHILFFVFHNLG